MADGPLCHVCGAGGLERIPGLAEFPLVSSDCRPTPMRVELFACSACGVVQKITDPAWSAGVETIYSSYAIYHQSAGAEQPVFDDGAARPRSAALLSWLAAQTKLPETGRLADLGCGNGAFLRQFASARPHWELSGLEWDERHREAITSISASSSFVSGGLDKLAGCFDAVSMIHVLEHIPAPAHILAEVRARLAPRGHLILLVPDFSQNPYDLTVADHCSHFSAGSLERLLQQSGFEILALSSGQAISKETAILVRPAGQSAGQPASVDVRAIRRAALGSLGHLSRVAGLARQAARREPVGIFGTSIGGVWLASLLGEGAGFFVDEDESRTGKTLMGLPVLAPDRVAEGKSVVVPLAPQVARSVSERLGRLYPKKHFIAVEPL